jgi:hypothetical protein
MNVGAKRRVLTVLLAFTSSCGSGSEESRERGSGGSGGGGGTWNGGTGGGAAGAGGSIVGGAAGVSAGGTAGSASGGTGGSRYIVPALNQCGALTSACDAPSDSDVRATYRKDYFFPDSVYNEYTDAPLAGGRFHVALVSAVAGDVTNVVIDGFDTVNLPTQSQPPLEWFHVWPRKLTAGQPFFVQFHSRDAKWDQKSTGTLSVSTSGGTAFSGAFPVAKSSVPITYVTTTDDTQTLLIHLKNTDSVAHTLERLIVNGADVTSATCIADSTLAPGATALWTLPLCAPAKLGEAWTVAAEFQNGPVSVGVGRVLPPRFPIVTWNNTSDCPFPDAKTANYEKHVAAGIDTLFLSSPNASDGCSFDPIALIDQAASDPTFQLVVGANTALAHSFSNVDGVAALMTGDESDGEIYESGDGTSRPAKIALEVDALWDKYPTRPTYNGAKTSGHNGTFAGTDDIQGMDVYIGGCAPHITVFGSGTPPRMPYDYLALTRSNHMPLPTWLYAQGLSPVSAWKAQPTPSEIYVQALSVVAAGGKGFMWFQSNMAKSSSTPDSWDAMSNVGRMLRGVRHILREGDVTQLAVAAPSAGTIAELIRGPDALVIPVIDVAAMSGPTDLTCALFSTPWVFASAQPDIIATIPDDVSVSEVFEVLPSAPYTAEFSGYTVAGRKLTLPAVALSNDMPIRLFVLAQSSAVRARVTTEMSY